MSLIKRHLGSSRSRVVDVKEMYKKVVMHVHSRCYAAHATNRFIAFSNVNSFT